jgi:Cupin-like domain
VTDLLPLEFAQSWVNKPFILKKPVKSWPLYTKWCQQSLLDKFGETVFRAEAVDWPLKTYVDYMNNTNDESPLYLFDRGFVEKMGLRVDKEGEYCPPECFGEDLFTLLGDQRPDHRWLIIGPERSGSTFHKDPNATSAWNAVIRGSKYWIMFPSSVLPPGVYMSEDQSEVTSPLSIGEWLLTFHEEARKTPGCLEGICGEGEVLHVPSGWWHLVVNLEPAIAITQNFVPMSHLAAAIAFLKHRPDQVSGFKSEVKDPHGLFIERLEAHRPDLLASLDEKNTRKRKWAEIVCDNDEQNGTAIGFSFGFGSDIEEEV